MGKALYDIPGLTHPGSLDSFWKNPQPVDMDLFDKFLSLLFQKIQVNGSFFKHWDISYPNALAFYEGMTEDAIILHTSPVFDQLKVTRVNSMT